MQTEGLGGPCPRCGEMNCFIKKGTGTWYDFIACPNCYFAYGENADNMLEETGGIVAGAEVWEGLLHAHSFNNMEDFNDFFNVDEEYMYVVESPFDFSDTEDWIKNLCVVSKHTIRVLIAGINEDLETEV